mgnify:CR=1 FL=1
MGFGTPADPQQPPRLLGIPFTTDYPLARRLAFQNHAPGMWQARQLWSGLHLNLLGRVHVAKQCLASKAVYHSAFVSPLSATQQQMARALRHFVGNSRDAADDISTGAAMHPGTMTAILQPEEGGVAMAHLPSMVAAMQGKNVARLFSPGLHPWQPVTKALLAAADPEAGLCTWAVTHPAPQRLLQSVPSARLADYVRAFQSAKPHRVVRPKDQGFYSVLAEPLYHNPLIAQAHLTSTSFTSATARAWRYLRDARAAMRDPDNVPLAVRRDFAHLLTLLPRPWRAVLGAGPSPTPPWTCALVDGRWWVTQPQQQQPFQPDAARSTQPDGRLLEGVFIGPLPPGLGTADWVPAAVFSRDKPQLRWTQQDRVEVEAAKEQGEEHTPLEYWLLGPWHAVDLDPSVWGFGGLPLHQFQVKAVRQRLVQLARAAIDDSYVPGHGVSPRIWVPATEPRAGVRFQLEQAWLQEYSRRQTDAPQAGPSAAPRTTAAFQRALDESAPPWLNLGAARQARPAPGARGRSARGAGGGGGSARRALKDPVRVLAEERLAGGAAAGGLRIWKALAGDSTLSRPHRVTAWRLLHGALSVRAARFVHSIAMPLQDAHCTHPACQSELETISHALFDCPAVRPVLEWLCAVWEAMAGERPPMDARVLLGGEGRVWQPVAAARAVLWQRLRVATVHAIWWCRCHRQEVTDSGMPLATRACIMVVEHIRDSIQRDFLRVETDVRTLDHAVPVVHFKGRDPALTQEDFDALWCEGGLLAQRSVTGVDVRLSRTAPVPVPGLQAAWDVG